MWMRFCKWLLLRCMGWTIEVTVDIPSKCIICLAPHTSNWDFLLGQLYLGATGQKSNFLMKKEWFAGPLGFMFRRLGGIPVDRGKHTSMTDAMAETATKSDSFVLCITPEGTRKLTHEWKKGFYFIALKAGIPILLYGLDYEKRLIKCVKTVVPSGHLDADMKEIKAYFKGMKGKYPENFSAEDE